MCITPPLGREIPGLFERRLAAGVHDDLFARAAVVDDGDTVVALVQTDTIKVSEDLVAAARQEAHRLCGVSEANCFISATHTHSGGPIFGGFTSTPDEDYVAAVASAIAGAIADAYRVRRTAVVGTHATTAPGVAFNRRFVMKDGTHQTHPGKMNRDIDRVAGPADPTVTVIGFRDPESFEPFGCIVNFACHGTHMNGLLYSADYPMWVVRSLRSTYGPEFGVTFLNNACGDVTQVDNLSPRPPEFGPYWCWRNGTAVGSAAVQALALMDYYRQATVAADSVTLTADIRDPGDAARKAAEDFLAEQPMTPSDIESVYAYELLQVDKMRREKASRDLEVSAVRIADALMWGVPGEYFQEYAARAREASQFPHTCCVELANGYNGYVCTEESYHLGGYEPRLARSSFLAEDTGRRICDAGIKLCDKMYRAAERELKGLQDCIAWISADDTALDGIKALKPRD